MLSETEQKIITAAKEVFSKKGYAGARMQEIADYAEINKGLLHYYFRSKDKLFQAVFNELFEMFVPKLNLIFESDLPLFEKIELFVHDYMELLIQNPYLPSFILHELNQTPDEFLHRILNNTVKPNPMKLLMQIQLEAQSGRIRPINPVQLMMNLISLCVFPFAARPLLKGILQLNETDYLTLMHLRKQEIITFVLNALRTEN